MADISLGIVLLNTPTRIADRLRYVSANRLAGLTGLHHKRVLEIARGEAIPTEHEAMLIREWFPNWEPLRVINPEQTKIGG